MVFRRRNDIGYDYSQHFLDYPSFYVNRVFKYTNLIMRRGSKEYYDFLLEKEKRFQDAWARKDWDVIWDCVYECTDNILRKMIKGHHCDVDTFLERRDQAAFESMRRIKNSLAKDPNFKIKQLVAYLNSGVPWSWRSPSNKNWDMHVVQPFVFDADGDDVYGESFIFVDNKYPGKTPENVFIELPLKEVTDMKRIYKQLKERKGTVIIKEFLQYYKQLKKDDKAYTQRLSALLSDRNMDYKLIGQIMEAAIKADQSGNGEDMEVRIKTKDSAEIVIRFNREEQKVENKIESMLRRV